MSRTPFGDPIAVGVDVVEIEKIGALLSHPIARLRRVFSSEELPAGTLSRTAMRLRLACVFTGKEAVFKALGRGWGQGIRWSDVGLSRGGDGSWSAMLAGAAAQRLAEIGGSRVQVSACSTGAHAFALALVLN